VQDHAQNQYVSVIS